MSFMSQGWDCEVPGVEYWEEVFRVLKPGAFLFAFSASRTYHHLAQAVEEAHFEIRDMFHWIYRTGMLYGASLPDDSHTHVRRAHEPILVARKPPEGNVLTNWKKWGTGGLNIQDCRGNGRLPSNVIDVDALEESFTDELSHHELYCPKPAKKEKELGLEDFPLCQPSHDGRKKAINNAFQRHDSFCRNPHQTVKPLVLMHYLCVLATPSGGMILDPFMGSGTTGMAAIAAGHPFLGIEKDPTYLNIAAARMRSIKRPSQTTHKP